MGDVAAQQSRIDVKAESDARGQFSAATPSLANAEQQNGGSESGQAVAPAAQRQASLNGYVGCAADGLAETPAMISICDGRKLPPEQTADTSDDQSSLSKDTFDPYEFGNEKNATSYWGTIMHMIIVCMSPTLLNLPATFMQVGYAVGSIGSFCTVLLYAYCMHMIVDGEYVLCKRLRRTKMSYTEIVYRAFRTGPKGLRWIASYSKNLIYAALISIWAGGNSIYVLLISDNIKSVLRYFYQWECTDRTIILWLVIPLVLLCWTPNLKLMVFYSSFSNTVNLCCILIISCITAQNMPALGDRKPFGDLSKVPYFLGVVFVTVNGTGLLMSLKNQMRNPRKFRSAAGVLNVSYVTTGTTYALFGLLCYLRYGAAVKSNVLSNLADNLFTNMVKLMYVLSVIFFYPLVSYVTFDIVWHEALKHKLATSSHHKIMKRVVQTCSASSSIVLAYVFPNLEIFVSITGTVCASLDSIIMPAIINMLVYSHQRRVLANVKNLAIISLGITFSVSGILDSFRALNRYYRGELTQL